MAKRKPVITVLAGTNGAGKSSIGGATIRAAGGTYFNPDEAARTIRSANPQISVAEANSDAWYRGKRLLDRAIAKRLDFAFETTLGGTSITESLLNAATTGFAVRIWYVALASPDLHISRVRERVAKGGHDIPEGDIRKRYDQSRLNLVRLVPVVDELKVFDNSATADPVRGDAPRPMLVVHVRQRRIVDHCALRDCPDWAKPILMAAIKSAR